MKYHSSSFKPNLKILLFIKRCTFEILKNHSVLVNPRSHTALYLILLFTCPRLSILPMPVVNNQFKYCDNGIVSQSHNKCRSLEFVPKEKTSARLSGEHCNIGTLWFKVKGIPVSPV